MPRLPDPDFSKFGHGISLLGGWLPTTIEVVTIVVVIAAVGWRSKRWRLLWVPVSVGIGALVAVTAWAWMDSEGLASNPPAPPLRLWLWTGASAAMLLAAAIGWTAASWRRRVLSLVAIPLTLLCSLLVLNQWVGYYPTVERAWGGDLTSGGPLPDQIDAGELAGGCATPALPPARCS